MLLRLRLDTSTTALKVTVKPTTVPSSVVRSLCLLCCRASTLSMSIWSFAAHRDYQPSKAFMQELSHQAMLTISSFDAVVSTPSTMALCRPLACRM